MNSKHALIAGWFSFQGHGHATAGDLLAAELTCDWLEELGYTCDLALDPPFAGGLDWRTTKAADYSHVIFVCGPFGKGKVTEEFMQHFSGCQIVGLNLTMNQSQASWNPFDALIERNNALTDSPELTRPDMTFLSGRPLVPVVGVCLVEPYGAKYEEEAFAAIKRLIGEREISIVQIDTRLDVNKVGLRSPSEVESLLARMDAVITTRLHGTVLSLKNGVPVIAIDPGGDSLKIKRLAERIEWPYAFRADQLDDKALSEALSFCLSDQGRQLADICRNRAVNLAREFRDLFGAAVQEHLPAGADRPRRYRNRITAELECRLDW